MKKNLLVGFLLILAACGSQVAKPYETPPRGVVIIFKDAPIQTKGKEILFGALRVQPFECVKFIDSVSKVSYFIPRTIGYDTLDIPTFNNVAEVELTFMAHETLKYMFEAGDTILITYNLDNRPLIQSKTSPERTNLYNLAYTSNYIEQKSGYSLYSVLTNRLYHIAFRSVKYKMNAKEPDFIKSADLKAYIDLDSVENLYNNYITTLSVLLDDMLAKKTIPQNQYDFQKNIIAENQFQIDKTYSFRHNNAKSREVKEVDFKYNDSLIHSLSYQMALKSIAGILIMSNNLNPEKAFDIITAKSNIPPLSRNTMLYMLITNIIDGIPMAYESTLKAEQEYVRKYIALTGDSTLKTNIISNTNVNSEDYAENLQLIDVNGNEQRLSDLLTKNRGKAIYIDFWATWCGPCQTEMPLFDALKKQYENQNILFVSLCVNDTKTRWLSDPQSKHTNSYFILNSKENTFLKAIKQSSIPQYIAFDKSGKLIDINAPRPSNNAIVDYLTNLLK